MKVSTLLICLALAGCKAEALSPCQCKDCAVQWTPKSGVYNDGTHVSDYDKWGRYTGNNPDVPQECRK